MTKQILIIGGGLSGLTLLHHLRCRFWDREDIQLRLLEKESSAGGNIATQDIGGCLFENGPNGFLNTRTSLLDIIKDLKLKDLLIESSPEAAKRFILYHNALHPLPARPRDIFSFSPLPLRSRMRVFCEFFISKGADPDETVEQFGRRRFGTSFTKYCLDPMVSGVFAGRAEDLVLRECFPGIYDLEQRHGSLIRALFQGGKNDTRNKKK